MPDNTKSRTVKIHTKNTGTLPLLKGMESNISTPLTKCLRLIEYIKGYSSKVVANNQQYFLEKQ